MEYEQKEVITCTDNLGGEGAGSSLIVLLD